MTGNSPAAPRRRLVILGSGFAAYSLLRGLDRARAGADITVVSPTNHFLFTPLLPSAAVGTVELRSILEPVLRRRPWIQLIEAEAVGADFAERTVSCRSAVSGESFPVPYDLLAIAVGARVADYGIPGVAAGALFVKTATDARGLRDRIQRQYAAADLPGLEPAEIERRLTFVVCGGGATGVEVAAEIHDLMEGEMRRLRPRLSGRGRVVLVEALDRILGSFDAALAARARERFARAGIEVRTGVPVARVEAGRVELGDGQAIDCGAVVWTGGNAPLPFTAGLAVELQGGRIVVDDRLAVVGVSGVWALGDCAVCRERPLPATAQVAQQQGKYLARLLLRRLAGRETPPFEARSLGMLAYIGGDEAIADLPRAKWSGHGAWLFWRSVYLTRLVSLPNKAKVLFDWWKDALFGRDTSRF